MATIRTESELLTIFADNTTGDITALDVRDFVVSSRIDSVAAHLSSTSNPHSVTASQVGALVSIDGVSNAGGNIDLIEGDNITISSNDFTDEITISSTGSYGTGTDNFITRWDGTSGGLQDTYLTHADSGATYFAGGNTRGAYATDFQSSRSAATQVASGSGSFIAGGQNNTASGNFSFATGSGSNASAVGSFACGYTTTTGAILTASGKGSHAGGYVSIAYSQITATGIGSQAVGMSLGGLGSLIKSLGNGSFASGYVNGGFIYSSGLGSFARGVSISSSIYASADGSSAEGTALLLGYITASGKGSHAGGYATGSGSTITAGTNQGAFAFGYAKSGGDILSSGIGSWAGGHVSYFSGAGTATASGNGSFAFGNNIGGTISASGDGSVVLGNPQQSYFLASGNGSFVFGSGVSGGVITASGSGSLASGYATTGETHIASALGASVFGRNNEASAIQAFAIGKDAIADRPGQLAQSSGGSFAADGDAHRTVTTLKASTTDDSATEMTIDGAAAAAGNRFTLDDESTLDCFVTITARQDTGAGQASFWRRVIIERTGGTTALSGSEATIGTDIGSNSGSPPAGWAVALTADDTNDSLVVTVTGAVGTNIRWLATIYANEIEYEDEGAPPS